MLIPDTEISPTRSNLSLSNKQFRIIAKTLHERAGIYLSDEKKSLVFSRLTKRIWKLGLNNFKEYCDLIVSNDGKQELQEMLSALTTNVTHFFREAHHFEHLQRKILPPLIEKASKGEKIRIWSAGCSNGSEPYSIALSALKAFPEVADMDIKILATDIDPNIISQARAGVYDNSSLQSLPPDLRIKYFSVKKRNGTKVFSVNPEVKKLVSFKELNLMDSVWPMKGKFHVIFCRNVTIYFTQETQQNIWSRYADYLYPHGCLYIGHSERINGIAEQKFKVDGITTYRLTK